MYDIYRQGAHSPCQHFAAAGYAALAAAIPANQYDGYPSDGREDDAPGSQARWMDLRVLSAIRGAEKPKKRTVKRRSKAGADDAGPKEKIMDIAGHGVRWHLALPELKIWAGQATMETLVSGRIAALHEAGDLPDDTRLLDWTIPYRTMSGLDPRTAATSIDIGFSPAALGMDMSTYVAAELLAVLGMELSPLLRYGREEYGYQDMHGDWWAFRVVERESYHRMLTMSERRDPARLECIVR
jgi:hypothetical protein